MTQIDARPIQDKIRTVFVSRPGVLQQSLQAILLTLSRLDVVGFASGEMTAINIVRSTQPTLLIIDAILPQEEIAALLQWTRQEELKIYSLVLIETKAQQHQAQTAGAHATLDRNCSIEHFGEAILKLGL